MTLFLTLLAWGGVLVTAAIFLAFLTDPARGMAQADHRLEQLPQVMTGRYAANAFLAVAAAIHGRPGPIAVLFAAFALMSFWDTWTYASRGLPYRPHALAGVASVLVAAVAVLVLVSQR